ncbi:PIH1 domain-containing protein 1-like isoform X2 [Oratosquilla oratoria]|uniref:PIH1 domain-containing protein 1-like isoform X2 n=1 Tax=Oratosquilla oratoria TaxID=337810 RepID=UPI003F775C75
MNSKQKATLLDIDDNIIKSQLLLEDVNPRKELETLFPESSSDQRTATITPKPGICIKTRDLLKKDGEKIFVNVCTSEAIPAPEDITDDELVAILDSDETSDFKVPMSIGQPHPEKDKGGKECTAFDVVINPAFLDKMADNPLFHNFFMVATFEGLDEKYNLELDKNGLVVLKNKKYHGTMPQQVVRTTVPLVQELSGVRQWGASDLPTATITEDSKGSGISQTEEPLISEVSTHSPVDKDAPPKKCQPVYKITKQYVGGKVNYLEAEVELPKTVNKLGVDVQVGEDRLVVESQHKLLDVFLPYIMQPQHSTAFFIQSERVLQINIPVI